MPELISAYPCYTCGGPVELVSGECSSCGQLHREPQPGPQTDLLNCQAKVALAGGAAGGGKSYGLLLDVLNRGCDLPGWSGVLIRREARDIFDAGGLWDKAKAVFKGSGAKFRGGAGAGDVSWPSGARLSFKHLKSDADLDSFQGPEYAWIGIDEATHLDMSWILYLVTRLRTACDTQAVMRMTCNPDPFHPLAEWVSWYLNEDGTADKAKCGTVRYWQRSSTSNDIEHAATREECAEASGRPLSDIKTFAFIPSLFEDNLALLAMDPDYGSSLAAKGAVSEAQLRYGNWLVKPETGGMLRKSRWQPVEAPLSPIVRRVRGWDKAGSRPRAAYPNPDFTAGVELQWDTEGRFYLAAVAACREEPAEVLRLQRSTATLDGRAVDQVSFTDPGAAGKEAALNTRRNFEASRRCGRVYFKPTGSKLDQKILNAQPLSQALEQGRGYILVGDWLDEPYIDAGSAPRTIGALVWSQVAAFVDVDGKAKDDIVDAMTVAFNHGDRGATTVKHRSTRDTLKAAGEELRKRQSLRSGGRRV